MIHNGIDNVFFPEFFLPISRIPILSGSLSSIFIRAKIRFHISFLNMEPKKEEKNVNQGIGLLIIEKKGSGKTTLINAITNYF